MTTRAASTFLLAALVVGARPTRAWAQTEAPEVPPETAPAPVRQRPLSSAPPAPSPPPTAPPGPVAPPPLTEEHPTTAVATRPAANEPDDVTFSPGARVDFDSHFFQTDDATPANKMLLRRARLEATGWIGAWVAFSVAAEYAASPSPTVDAATFTPTDVFVALAPRLNRLVLQVGTFDAPFTLENRISDRWLDFLERSIALRAFGIPENKATGAMVSGFDDDRHFHYALGVFAGDGPSPRSFDDQFDVMGRAWIAPFSFAGDGPLRDLTLGGSFWTGDRENALPLAAQTTPGGLAFATFEPYAATVGGTATRTQLRQVGLMRAAAVELNAPIAHRYGLRGEMVWRESPLSEEDVTSAMKPTILGGAGLHGWAGYAEVWFWALGDDRLEADHQGLRPLTRAASAPAPGDGLMLALRASHLDEEVWQERDAALLNLRDPAVGITQVTSVELGVNYFRAGRFRATCNYVLNHFSGTTPHVAAFKSPTEQELLFRLGIAL